MFIWWAYDFSHIEALRDDVDALHMRWRATFAAGGIDLFTFQEKIGLTPDEAYRGWYAKPSSALESGDEGGDEIKDVTRGKTTGNPHNTAGSFAHGGGNARALPTQSVSGALGGGSASSGSSSSGSSSGSVGAARAKLHEEHGVDHGEQGIAYSDVAEATIDTFILSRVKDSLIDHLWLEQSQSLCSNAVIVETWFRETWLRDGFN